MKVISIDHYDLLIESFFKTVTPIGFIIRDDYACFANSIVTQKIYTHEKHTNTTLNPLLL